VRLSTSRCLFSDAFATMSDMARPPIPITPQAVKRIRNHDCWVFRDELLDPRPQVQPGEVVAVTERQGTFVAYAFYNPQSHIALRIVSLAQDEPVDRALIGERIKQAITRRRPLRATNARRLVFSEADRLPGLIVDQYADYLVVQFRSAGIDGLRQTVVDLIQELVRPTGMLERSDKAFRDEEGLPPVTQIVLGAVPDLILIEEDGLQFWVDPYHGQKTGFYLDQRDTRRCVRERIQPGQRVADVFAYTGAFGVGAASRGAHVVCVEQQESCLALAKDNAALNHVEDRMDWVAGDAFYWLEAAERRGERFDWVLLDPPALAKSKADLPKGRHALHRLVASALGLLTPNGTLVLSVCTYHLLGLAEEIVRMAAQQRQIRLRVQGRSLQAADHPWILQMPMTRYLMSWQVQRDGSPAA